MSIQQDVETQIQGLLASEFGLDENIPPDAPVFSSGALDSMDVLKLMMLLETKFSITIPTFEVSLEMFDTVAQITDLVTKRQGA